MSHYFSLGQLSSSALNELLSENLYIYIYIYIFLFFVFFFILGDFLRSLSNNKLQEIPERAFRKLTNVRFM